MSNVFDSKTGTKVSSFSELFPKVQIYFFIFNQFFSSLFASVSISNLKSIGQIIFNLFFSSINESASLFFLILSSS